MTGYGQPYDRELSQAAGFDYHFVKPLAAAELNAILNRLGSIGIGTESRDEAGTHSA